MQFVWKRILECALPYALWTIIYFIYYNGAHDILSLSGIKIILKNIIRGDGAYHLWYVVMIFQFYLLFPAFLILIKKIQKALIQEWSFHCYSEYLQFSTFVLCILHTPMFSTQVQTLLDTFLSNLGAGIFYITFFILFLVDLQVYTLPLWRNFIKRTFRWNILLSLLLFAWVEYELMKNGYSKGKINLSVSATFKPSMFLFTSIQI